VSFLTSPIFEGNHASIHIPDEVLARLGANRRAPLKVTVRNHAYQSTATGVGGQCRVVFPQKERVAAGVDSSAEIEVTLELDAGTREVAIPEVLAKALVESELKSAFDGLAYSKRRAFALQVAEAKTQATLERRISKVLAALS